MKVTELKNEGLARQYKIEVPATELQAGFDVEIAKIAPKIKRSGFRPGKVPMQVIKQQYANDPEVMSNVLESVVQNKVTTLLKDKKDEPAMQPKIELVGGGMSFSYEKTLEFTVDYEITPQFDLKAFEDITLERQVAEPSDAKVEESLRKLAENSRQPKTVNPIRPAKSGDVVLINFDGSVDGVRHDGMKAEGFRLELGSNSFVDTFEEQLIGINAGESLTVTVTFPEAYHAKNLAGKVAIFEVTCTDVQELEMPELDDKFAEIYGKKSLSELKDSLKVRLTDEYNAASKVLLKKSLLDALDAAYDFPLPQQMVNSEFEGIWKQFENEKKLGHISKDEAAKGDDEMRKELQTIAARRVRLGLILGVVGRTEKVEITQDDLNKALLNEVKRYPSQAAQVFEYYRKNPDAMASLRAPIYEEKIVSSIFSKVTLKDISVSEEDLLKAANEFEMDESDLDEHDHHDHSHDDHDHSTCGHDHHH